MMVLHRWTIVAGLGLAAACAAPPPTFAAPSQVTAELRLIRSTPTSGATVHGPVDELLLQFSRRARLLEVTVSGPGGDMPMMVDAAGETDKYSIPLPGLEAGKYEVRWRASAAGQERAGSLTFAVQ